MTLNLHVFWIYLNMWLKKKRHILNRKSWKTRRLIAQASSCWIRSLGLKERSGGTKIKVEVSGGFFLWGPATFLKQCTIHVILYYIIIYYIKEPTNEPIIRFFWKYSQRIQTNAVHLDHRLPANKKFPKIFCRGTVRHGTLHNECNVFFVFFLTCSQ